jgi:hypothetical protein
MAAYKNKETFNIDTYKINTAGALSSKVGYIRAGEQFNADDLGAVLKITSGEDAGRFVYERYCAIASSTTPSPPSTSAARIVLTEADGRQRIFEEVL